MMTTIQITGLQTFGYHGLFEERSLGQKFTFDIDATLSPAPTHRDDRLDASIRYDAVVDAAVSLASGMKYQTLEALGEAVAIGLLRRFVLIDTITVGVSKFSPPQSRIRSAKSESRCAWLDPIWRIGPHLSAEMTPECASLHPGYMLISPTHNRGFTQTPHSRD